MSLALNEQKWVAHHSISNSTFEHAPQVERKMMILYAKVPMDNHRAPEK
jgi:hypothetical protein